VRQSQLGLAELLPTQMCKGRSTDRKGDLGTATSCKCEIESLWASRSSKPLQAVSSSGVVI
jgi:hypothetical protein